MSDPETSALAVYWRFFEVTNSRDSKQVTDALNYPHVRISARGNPNIVQHRQTHAGKMSFDPMISTGWDHTVGMEPDVLHVSRRARYISRAAGPDTTVTTDRS